MTYLERQAGTVRYLRYPGGDHPVKWRSDCATCVHYGGDNPDPDGILFWPSHDASRMCKSGSRPHCTCDGCF